MPTLPCDAGKLGNVRSATPSRRSILALATAASLYSLVLASGSVAAPKGPGPKKRIAVAKFDADTAFDKAYGTADPGGGLAAQLTTELVNSGQFLVEERANLESVTAEQKLGTSHTAMAETAAFPGQLLGAQVLVRASVTMFEPSAKSSGFSLGIGGATVGRNSSSGKIGIDLRLIDTATGQVIGATHIEQEVESSDVSTNYSNNSGTTTAGGDIGSSTVIGETTRSMIDKAVEFIEQKLVDVDWAGQVTDADAGSVYLNMGADGNVAMGDQFAISRISRRITDPQSGEVLGVMEDKIGLVKVTNVQPRFSIASPVGAVAARRGDIARFVSN